MSEVTWVDRSLAGVKPANRPGGKALARADDNSDARENWYSKETIYYRIIGGRKEPGDLVCLMFCGELKPTVRAVKLTVKLAEHSPSWMFIINCWIYVD
jgi:hypothetical protein